MGKDQTHNIESSPTNIAQAAELYRQGAEAWKKGDRAKAMTLYSRSAELDPDGPGVQALNMTREIMSFFNPDQFNP